LYVESREAKPAEQRLYKNQFKDTRHHLPPKTLTRIMLKTKVIITVLGFLAFESCQAFYRPMPSFLDKMINQVLDNQLEARFGKLIAATTKDQLQQRFGKLTKIGPQSEAAQTAPQTTIAPTTTVETTTRSATIETTVQPKTHKVKLCHFKTFEACTLDEWTKFISHVLKNRKGTKFFSHVLKNKNHRTYHKHNMF
jgi:hypothetical protein